MKIYILTILLVVFWFTFTNAQRKVTISAFTGIGINLHNNVYSTSGIYAPFVAKSKAFPNLGISFDYLGKRNPKCFNRLFIASHTIGQRVVADKSNFTMAEKLYVQSILYSIQAGYNKEWQVANISKKNIKLFAGFITSINYGLALQSNYNNQILIDKQGDSLYLINDPRLVKRGTFAMINVGLTNRLVFYNKMGKEKYSTGIQYMAGLGNLSSHMFSYVYGYYADRIVAQNRGYLCNIYFSIPIFRR